MRRKIRVGVIGNEEEQLDFTFDHRGFGENYAGPLQRHVVDHLSRAGPLENTCCEYLWNLEIEAALYKSNAQKAWIDLDDQNTGHLP